MSSKIKSLKYNGKWDFSPSIESIENLSIQKEYELFINGKFQKPFAKKYFPSINPSNEQKLSRIAKAEFKDVDLAVNSARDAFNGQWGKISGKDRAKYIYRIARLIQEKSKELAIVETLDGGKPIRESRDIDIPLAAAHFFYYAGWADKLKYAFPNRTPKPLGVVGQIIPWNFPLMMAAWKIAPALATGNTVVLKPAESTSITALLLAEIIKEAELPQGVVNIITGDGSTGNIIVNHPDVNKIAFTGSTEVGKSIMESISGTNKRSTMELGGKAANIIFEDAPLDQAVEGVINGIYFNQGHVCCAGSRLFIQESVYDVVLRKLKDRMQSLVVGNPLDKNTDIGAVNSKQQLSTINKYINIGVKEGADIFQLNCELPNSGYWCPPTLFTNVSQSHSIAKEEIFGPVLAVQTFRTTQEVINKANNTPYGLSAGVWTDKGSKAFNLATKLKAGVIWANTYNKFDPTSPFGGYKESGHGREGGLHGLSPYLNLE
tara:strand:+ start:1402 stop:2871 length:1470 start_codon:yes stop_codon:yes gene_type:complete